MFDITNLSGFPITIQNFTPSLDAGTFTIQVYTTTSATTWNGNQTNPGAWTLLGSSSITSVGANPGTVVPGYGLVLAPGASKGIYITSTTGFPMNYTGIGTGTFRTFNDGTLRVSANPGAGKGFPFAATFISRAYNGGVTYATAAEGLSQTAGLPSGSTFPQGTTTNTFKCTDLAGLMSTCSFTVTVLEFPNPTATLTCNDLVNISLDEDCVTAIGADQVLEGGLYGCYDDYIVELDKTAPYGNGPWVPAVVGSSDIGKTYQVRVTDPETGNKCWGSVKIEDKLPPVMECFDFSVPCNGSTAPTAQPGSFAGKANSTAPVAILDVATVQSTANFSSCPTASIEDVNVKVDITHTFIGDLTIELISPEGTLFSLWGGFCGGTDNFRVTFDDEAATCSNACVDYTVGNTLIPVSCLGLGTTVLSDFDGENPNGTWTLRVRDAFGGDVGTINSFSVSIQYNSPCGNQPIVSDNCGPYDLTYIDQQVSNNCASGLTGTVIRKWTATDASGNTSTCIQNIGLIRPTLADVTVPPDYDGIDAPAFECIDNAYPTPEWIEAQGLQGGPWVFGQPEGCSIGWEYEDHVIDVCDGTYKILREWFVIDWCTGTSIEHDQIIKVLDEAGPTIACPANMTVTTEPFNCCAITNLPDVIISDNCSRINNVSAMVIGFDPFTGEQIGMFNVGGSVADFPGNNWWNPDTLGAYGTTPCLPLGTHTVIYMAEDDCGNTSTCSFRLTVRDYTPPQVASDNVTVVSIGVDDPYDCYGPAGFQNVPEALDACSFGGVSWVKAKSLDDGTYDNCGNVKFTVQRMSPYSDCINNLNQINGQPSCNDPFNDFPSEFERAISEGDSIKFYCCEVGTTQMVIFRAYQVDVNGNISIGPDGTPVLNSTMVEVTVQDKIRAVCVPPANVVTTCELFDNSLWAYGKASVYDNCCLDTSRVYQGQCGLTHTASLSNFDTVCNKGTITRTFRAYDCHGNPFSQCTQRIIVNYEQDYYVRFPDDRIVTVCNSSGNYGAPTFFGEDCELLGVSYEDAIFTVVPDACYKIERTWTVINWCTYNTNLGCINVPNPNPSNTTNATANLPGPIVSPVQTIGDPWKSTIVKINPSDALATNYSTFWDPNANCYKYKQIIKVIDTQDPVITCPASPVEICDVTPNNPQLWNADYWWDNTIGSHDLCEAPTDLTISATDACSGANLNIEYTLFLDLDGDNVMETIVNSTNLPGFNTIYVGNNDNDADLTDGTARAFDGRPVSFNQKYGFAIQETVSGVNRTASVRWNTFQSPNTYVVPELPYGTHKIKWFAYDGCGNESVCEYTFVVKDCKAPTVTCLNGLSVNIMPTQMVVMWASDFLQYTEDNCTPANQIKIGIRKSSEGGTGFPVDGAGNPITSVTFTCDELGTQFVELWGIDVAGNADYCETYIIVQDNAGNCPNNDKISVAGVLATEMNDGLDEAGVEFAGSHPALPPVSMFDLTNATGNYEFPNALPLAGNYTVTPVEDENPLNGVSTLDLVAISKHILGLEPLSSPYKMIAADANKSGSITTFDIVEIRKLILGVYDELPNNTSWRFVDKGYVFPNMQNPFAATFPEVVSVASAATSATDENFVSVKVGDVNNSAVANLTMSADDRTSGTLLFDVEDRAVKAGEEVIVKFTAAEAVAGYQFTLGFKGMQVLDVQPLTAGMNMGNFGVFADAVTTSFDGAVAGEFAVRFKAQQSGQLSQLLGVSSRITKSEAYGANGRQDVAIRFNGANGSTISGVGFELYQNVPNPFVGKTQIGFHLPEAGDATLRIMDEAGRVVYSQTGSFTKGRNVITLDRAVVTTTGLLFYTLETATDSATKKMIQSK
jgi:subtilisin-like proprotein convertase family protein